MAQAADLLVLNSRKMVTLAGPPRARVGEEMSDLGAIDGGAVAIADGVIIEVGTSDQLAHKHAAAERIDAAGRLVMPGFVDCHTHAVFLHVRADEFARRAAGASYLDILAGGGGIHRTVRETQAASVDELEAATAERLATMLAHGTTTVEIKSGYGLETKAERKMLDVARAAGQRLPIDVVTTYLGAHTAPQGAERDAYIGDVLADLPAMREAAEFCDVFCEREAFTLAETRRILETAGRHGYGLKIHAGQFSDLGAAGLAAELGAVSAEHLEHVSDGDLAAMAEAGTIAVLLPGVSLYLLSDVYADARRMISLDVPVALATDVNAGSCPSGSMQMMLSLACLKLRMTPAEAITAATINAAWAIGRGGRVGSIEVGKQADLLVVDADDEADLCCRFGVNNIRTVIKAGRNVTTRPELDV